MAVDNFEKNFNNLIEKINYRTVLWGFIVYYALVLVAWGLSRREKKDELTLDSDTIKALALLPVVLPNLLLVLVVIYADYKGYR